MSEAAPGEPIYGAGEDIPGTPGPFPYGRISFAFACASAMIASLWFLGNGAFNSEPLYLFASLGWLFFGAIGLFHGQWKGAALGLIPLAAPWVAIYVLIAMAFS